MSENPIALAARAAARELGPQLGRPQLEADVDAVLFSAGAPQSPSQFIDPVALGSLIVSIAGLAWQVYRDQKKDGSKPTHKVLARMIRLHYRESGDLTGAEEKIIEIVTDEILKSVEDDE